MSRILEALERERGIRLNEQQKQAVLSEAGHTLLLAVPGSGKTTVLTARVAHCIAERGIDPNRILTLTFSRETASDMKRRFEALFPDLPPVRFSTIHSFCYSVLRYYAKVYRRTLPTLLAGEQAGIKYKLLRDCMRRVTGEYATDDVLEELEQHIGKVKNRMTPPEKAETGIENFAEICKAYTSACRENRLMDFDDMLVLCHDVFRRCPDILSHFCQSYDVICVDEAQDTSALQHRILELLVKGNTELFMVGDEDQSIYSFRGASPDELLVFEKTYPGAVVLKMETNYRSNRDIVEKADRFISQNRARYEKHMTCENENTGSVERVRLSDYREQGTRILRMLDPKKGKTAILYKNNESAVALVDLFLREGIPFSCRERELSFFNSMVVEDVRAYFRLAADPCDIEAFARIYYKLGCSKLMFDYAKANLEKYPTILDCMASFSSLQDYRCAMLLRSKDTLNRLLMMRPADAIAAIRKDLGYDRFIERKLHGFSRISAFQKLSALECIAADLRRPIELNGRLAFLAEAMKTASDPDASVLFSTIHSSKGMEFDTVFLVDLFDDILPSCDAKEQKAEGDLTEYENEVRLFYVAATRAKTKLVLFESDRLNGEDVALSPFITQFMRDTAAKKAPSFLKSADLQLAAGDYVTHRAFGKGFVLFVSGDFATIRFDEFGCKRLSVPVCAENHLLKRS